MLFGLFFIILHNCFDILGPIIVRIAFNRSHELTQLYSNFSGTVVGENYLDNILFSALIFGGLVVLFALIKGAFLYATRQTIIVMSRYIEYDLKNEIYEHYQRLSSSFYSKNYTGDLMARISEDVSRVRMYLGPAVMYSLNMVFKFIMVISVMMSINPGLSVYVLMPLPLLSFLIYKISAIINVKSDRIQRQMSTLTVFGQETFSGIRVIKSFGAESHFEKMFEKECEEYRVRSMGLVKVNSLFMPLMIMLVGMSTVLTIYFGSKEVIAGNFTYGNIAEFVIYVNMLTWPVASLGWVTAIIQRASASQSRINEFLNEKEEIEDTVGDEFVFNDKISFQNVSYKYEDKELNALDSISLDIPKGSTLGILGATGSGKSTVANLLLRMYDPIDGEITMDGKNLKSIKLGKYREAIAYVPQDVFLFSETIEENIAFGLKDYDSKRDFSKIEEVAKLAMVHDNIIEFKNGYQTLLGERGITVSGGQKQRIAIARALIRNAEILVLDDCLSAVDQNTEAAILENLQSQMENRTAVVISHRVSTVMHADMVIILEDGKIIEKGKPTELLEKNGQFAKLHLKQLSRERSDLLNI
jgi:ATP-binding cassette subfamily B multidrug efflux pump